MVNVIVVLPKLEEAKTIKSILVRNGYRGTTVAATGAQAISQADGLRDGLVICGYKLEDMLYQELRDYLPQDFELLLLASQRILAEVYGEGVMGLSMPLRLNDLLDTVGMLSEGIERKRRKRQAAPKTRSSQEEAIIREAKEVLMGRNHVTEAEAHQYLQRCSMESGSDLTETAQMVLAMMQE